MQIFKKHKGAALAGLTCAVLGASLAGCNNGNNGGGGSVIGGGGGGGGGETLAVVGDAKVTRTDLANFLEAQQGEQVLPYLIDTQLIFENLKSKGLDVTDAEIDADLARRQESDPRVTEIVTAGGAKLQAAKQQIKRELAVQKILTADVKPTEAQLKEFFTKNARFYDQPAKAKVGLLFASTKARADLMARQLAQKTKTFEALVEEQKKANDPLAGQSTAARDEFETLSNFSPQIAAQLQKIAKGATTAAQQINVGLPTPVHVIFKKVDFQPAKKADFTALRPQVEMDYKLAQVAQKTVSQNPQNPPFAETLQRTQQFMQSQNPAGGAPKLRDVLTYINQTPAATLLTSLRTAGKVQIDDPAYATIAQQYQAAPSPTGGADAGGAAGNTASNAASNAAPSSAPAGNAAPAPAAP